jgi:hypothetical protein
MENAAAPPDATIGPIPANPGENFVAPVTVNPNETKFQDLPVRAQEISSGLNKVASGTATPEDRIKFADNVNSHDKESDQYHPNSKPQWGAMFFSAMDNNWNDVYKYYNGGKTREERARDLQGNTYWKGYNEIGDNGSIKDSKGRELSSKEKEAINAQGGIISASDKDTIRTAPWINGQTNIALANRGITDQLNVTTNAAYNAARNASASNFNIDEQLHLAKKNRHVLDYIATLPSDTRAALLGNINKYNTINSSKSNERNKAIGASGSDLTSVGNTANIDAKLGAKGQPGGIAPPEGSSSGVGGGMGASGTAQTTNSANARDATAASASSGQTLQNQQNLQSAIMEVMQGVIKTPQEFQDFARLQSLNARNEADAANVPDFVKPAGFVNVTGTDIYTGGTDAVIMNRVQHQRNNALMAAWSSELMKAARKVAGTGQLIDRDSLSKQFAESPLYQAINNTYDEKMNIHLKGQGKHPKGTLMVNESNQLVTK